MWFAGDSILAASFELDDMPDIFAPGTFTYRPRWFNIILMGVIHAGCIAAPFYFSWSAVAVCFFLGWVSCCLGITLGWHRLLTHRSYETSRPVKYFVTLCGCLAWQNGPIEWVGTHRIHHAHTDESPDPHSPRDHSRGGRIKRALSLFWAHAGWVFVHLEKDPCKAAKDLQRDPVMRVIDRLFWLPGILLGGVLYLIGEYAIGGQGIAWVIWGICVRTTMMYHATWLVNSASHAWGYRNFDTTDDSTNLWWVAIITFGEGWHNNHHAQQRSAAHGMRWWEFDLTWQIIRLMRACGLVWDVVEPKLERMTDRHKLADSSFYRQPAVVETDAADSEESLPRGVTQQAGAS